MTQDPNGAVGTQRQFAPAKVNLALHVTGRRADGYHLLDSLVVFAGVGDWLQITPSDDLSLLVTGPRADGVPDDARNLVWKAAQWLDPEGAADITLEKHLPHAGGIGGGSSDAAAALRGLAETWGVPIPDGVQLLGADLPVCLRASACRMSGIGDLLADVPSLPEMWMVLVNPGVEVPTGDVFKSLEGVDNAPMPQAVWNDFDSFIAWLASTRNDLQSAAKSIAPAISEVVETLSATSGCALARMSGSGATCFGLFRDETTARAAGQSLPVQWWRAAAKVLP